MPLGIAGLASVLERAGHEVAILDPCPLQLTIEEIVGWIKKENPDILGISALTHVSKNAYAIADMFKKEMPDISIIMGGSHCTIFPYRVMKECSSIDVVVIGEAEERITQLADAVAKRSGLREIKGLIYRDFNSKEVVETGPPDIQKNLDLFPFPARHLFRNDLYTPFPDQIRKTPVTNVMTSRGCTWKRCKFCFEGGKFMPVYRRRSPENIIEELKQIRNMGFNGFAFWDDNFCSSEMWVGRVCDLLKQEKLELTWTCYGRANTITEKMVYDLKSAGCFSIYIGFESGNQKILDLVQKGTTLDEARKAVKLCRRAGIEVRGSFILGLPGDTPETAQESIDFAKELDLDFVKFMLYTPEQGTELYDIAVNSGQIIDRGFQGSLTKATYLPNGYKSVQQLEKIAQKANMSYVFRPKFILRKLLSIRGWQDFRKYFDGFLMMSSLKR
ncbi:B12-binding domain-containing radical SAM protein [Patescibacteria group bacterium]|nr:B12-binding domain-containing radical SAM protein [Patescibacteria group bacterium]